MPEKITAAERRRMASFRAGLILESVIQAGWWPEELEHRYGPDVLQLLIGDMEDIAAKLVETSGRRPG